METVRAITQANHRTREEHMRSPPQPKVGRNHPYPLPESHMLVLEDTMRRHPAPYDTRVRHIQAAVLLLIAACVLLILVDNLPDHRAIAHFPLPTGQAAYQQPGGVSGATVNTIVTCERDRVCDEGGS
jgi:hypothetical protein